MSSNISVDVHGSCVARCVFNVEKDYVKVNHNFSRNNIVSCMMPPAYIELRQGELQYTSDYSFRCVQYALNKQTLPLLLESDSDYLVIDFFDFCQNVAAYENTTFSTYDYTILKAPSIQPYINKMKHFSFFEIPRWLWYGYVDLYFERVKERFGDKIVLVRLRCCDKYVSKTKEVLPTPERLLFFGNAKYNQSLQDLEDYVIQKYDPYVIDVSKYFIADEQYNPDVTPVHFEEDFQKSAWRIMKHIIRSKPQQRYYDFISSDTVSDLLTRPVSDDNFSWICQNSATPFSSCEFIDEVCIKLSKEDVVANREWLGELYRIYDNSQINPPLHYTLGKINEFMEKLKKKQSKDGFSNMFTEMLIQKQYLLGESPERLYKQFLSALEAGDLIWTTALSCLRILTPENEDVVYYSQQYYRAINEM